MAVVARWSHMLLYSLSAWPLTQLNDSVWCLVSSYSSLHRSSFKTGLLSAFLKSCATQLASQPWLKAFVMYEESENTSTSQLSLRHLRPLMSAVSSIRLLVVHPSAPDSLFSAFPYIRTAAQPPTPGLPEHAPSEYSITLFFISPSLYLESSLERAMQAATALSMMP